MRKKRGGRTSERERRIEKNCQLAGSEKISFFFWNQSANFNSMLFYSQNALTIREETT